MTFNHLLIIILAGIFIAIISLGLLIISTIEQRSLWSERPYTITAFDLDYARLDFCGKFYVNQVDTEAKQISFTQILDNGKAKTRVDLPYIASDSYLESLLEKHPNFYGISLDKIIEVLDKSEIEFAAIIVKEETVFDLYLLERGKAVYFGRNRVRLFGYNNTQIDVFGFDIVTYKRGKTKRISGD